MRIIQTPVGLCLLAALLAPAAAAEELFLSVDFEPPVHSTSEFGEVLQVPGADLLGRPGQPLLPQKNLNFLLPQGHRAVNVRLEALVVEPLDGNYAIMPAQQPVPISKMYQARPTAPDPVVYEREDAFPGKWVETGAIQFKHGYAVLPVTLHPLSYHPRSGKLKRIASVTVVVETGPGGPISPRLRADPTDTDRVMRLCDVVTPVRSYRRPVTRGPNQLPPGDYRYVIITPEIFQGQAEPGPLEALRDARIAGGLTARIETLEWIRANFDGSRPDGGQDDATRIRNFLIAAHDEWGTQFALLVGDADAEDVGGESGDDLLQVRKLYVNPGAGMSPDHIPADLYYSCLDGSFDYDSDGYYGEYNDGPAGGEVDLLSEVYVGRAPADSSEEVSNFVAKTLAYENAAGNWLKDVWMVGELLFDNPTYWAADDLDDLINGVGQVLGFSSFPFYECHTLYDRDAGVGESWDADDLIPILNGGLHIVNHLGHSNVYYNMRMQTPDIGDLINIHPFLQYSQGCLNGSFDNRADADSGGYTYAQDCISEHLVTGEHGAFAAIVNSRYGFASGYSHQFNRWFWNAFFSQGISTIGEAFAYCKDENAYLFNDPGYRWAGYTVNLLGDPASIMKKSINTTEPILGVYPPGLTFFHIVGDHNPDPETMRIRNDGVGDITFTAAADQPWISLSSSSGPAPAELDVYIDPSSLAPGEYHGVVTVSSNEAPNSPVEMPVDLVVVEVPRIDVPHTRQAPEVDGQLTPGEYDEALALPIGVETAGDVTLYLLVSGNELFLAADDLSDTSPGSWDAFYLLFDRDLDGQWPSSTGDDGEYILAARSGGYTIYIPNINRGSGIERSWRSAEEFPTGWRGRSGFQDGHRFWEAALDMEVSHLDVGPEGAFGVFIYSVNTADENTRYVTGRWPTVVPQIDNQLYFGHVNLCPEGPRLDSSPLSMTYSAVVDESAPAPQQLSVFDRKGGNIDFTAAASDAWLSVSPTSGQTPADLAVSIDHSGLPPGDHRGTVIIEAETWNSPYEVPVLLRVWAPNARLEVDPDSLLITASADGPNPSAELSVGNVGGQPMNFVVTPSVPWLSADPQTGSIGPYSDRVVTMTADLSELGQGSHPAEINVRAGHPAENSPQIVSVQLDIVAPRPVPPVEDLSVGVLDQSLQLTWVCPDDPIVTGVMIRRGMSTAPAGPELGELIYDGMEERLTDEGLQNGTRYCYSAFAYDAAGRYAEQASACGIPGPNRAPPMPELLSPASGAAVPATPQLVASTVTDPDGDVVAYTFVLLGSSGSTLDSAVVEGSGNRVNWLPNAELQPEVSYRWQAEAIDSQGAHSGFGETRSFIIRPPTDGGSDGGQPGDDEPGCGCGHTNSATPGLLLFVAGLMLLRRRRKR